MPRPIFSDDISFLPKKSLIPAASTGKKLVGRRTLELSEIRLDRRICFNRIVIARVKFMMIKTRQRILNESILFEGGFIHFLNIYIWYKLHRVYNQARDKLNWRRNREIPRITKYASPCLSRGGQKIRRPIPSVSSGVHASHHVQFRSAGFTHLQLPGVEDIARGNG